MEQFYPLDVSDSLNGAYLGAPGVTEASDNVGPTLPMSKLAGGNAPSAVLAWWIGLLGVLVLAHVLTIKFQG